MPFDKETCMPYFSIDLLFVTRQPPSDRPPVPSVAASCEIAGERTCLCSSSHPVELFVRTNLMTVWCKKNRPEHRLGAAHALHPLHLPTFSTLTVHRVLSSGWAHSSPRLVSLANAGGSLYPFISATEAPHGFLL